MRCLKLNFFVMQESKEISQGKELPGEITPSPEEGTATSMQEEFEALKLQNPKLWKVFQSELKIRKLTSEPITPIPPFISWEGKPIFSIGTVNIIQGAQGCHKSRLSQTLCSLLLKSYSEIAEYLGFTKEGLDGEDCLVCYIDTERNLEEELPKAIQSIKLNAGFSITEHPENFRYTSLRDIPRNDRLSVLKEYLKSVRSVTSKRGFVVLDVVTDCISDFNNPKESLELFDFLNILCQEYSVTFLLTIHVNPGSEKARGHVGTEGVIKATTVMQVSHVDGNTYAIEYKKNRNSEKLPSLYFMYHAESDKLIRVADTVGHMLSLQVAPIEKIAEKLPDLIEDSITQQNLVEELRRAFGASKNTIIDRLTDICTRKTVLTKGSEKFNLQKTSCTGKSTIYSFNPVNAIDEVSEE